MVSYSLRYSVKTVDGEIITGLTEAQKNSYISSGATLYATTKTREGEEEGVRVNTTPNLSTNPAHTSSYYLQITGEANPCTNGNESDYIIAAGNGNSYVDSYRNLDSFYVD